MRKFCFYPFLVFSTISLNADEAESAFLQASVGLDRALIPALMATRAGDEGESIAAVSNLVQVWDGYQAGQEAYLAEAGGWSLLRDGITQRLGMAERFVGSDDVGMAHLMLEQVRRDLIRLRESLDSETFADRLVAYHDLMEAVLGDGSELLENRDRDVFREQVDELRDAWDAVEKIKIEEEIYGFLWKDVSTLKELMNAENQAIDDLADAIRRGLIEEFNGLAENIRQAFMATYLFFGAVE